MYRKKRRPSQERSDDERGLLFEQSPLYRLVAWLSSQKSLGNVLRGGNLVESIENVLDLYLADGPSERLQNAFNALAARRRHYGRVALRLRVRPTNPRKAWRLLEQSIQSLASSPAQMRAIVGSNPDSRAVAKVLSLIPSKSSDQIRDYLKPRLVGAIPNPLFDLWLTLLDPEAARRLRRSKTEDCKRYFIAWPAKKEFCSSTCRNRFWTRPRRRGEGHVPSTS